AVSRSVLTRRPSPGWSPPSRGCRVNPRAYGADLGLPPAAGRAQGYRRAGRRRDHPPRPRPAQRRPVRVPQPSLRPPEGPGLAGGQIRPLLLAQPRVAAVINSKSVLGVAPDGLVFPIRAELHDGAVRPRVSSITVRVPLLSSSGP